MFCYIQKHSTLKIKFMSNWCSSSKNTFLSLVHPTEQRWRTFKRTDISLRTRGRIAWSVMFPAALWAWVPDGEFVARHEEYRCIRRRIPTNTGILQNLTLNPAAWISIWSKNDRPEAYFSYIMGWHSASEKRECMEGEKVKVWKGGYTRS